MPLGVPHPSALTCTASGRRSCRGRGTGRVTSDRRRTARTRERATRTRRASGRCTLSSVRRRSPPYNGHGERLEGVLSPQSVDVLLPTTDTESVWKVYSLLSPSTFSSLQRTRRASGRCTLSSVRRRSPAYNGHGERLEGVLSPQSVDVLLPTTTAQRRFVKLKRATRTRRASGRCTLSSVRRRSPAYNGHGERLEGVLSPQSVDVLLPTTDTESVWKVYSLLSPSTFSSLQRTRRASGRCTLFSVRRRSPPYNGHGERLEGVLSPQSVDVLLPTTDTESVWKVYSLLSPSTFSSLQRTRRASGRCTLFSVRRRSPPYNGHGERLEGVLSSQSVDVLLPTTDTESVWKVYSLLSPSTFSSLQRTRRASGRCTLFSVRRRSPPYNGHGERLEGVLSPQSVDVLLPTTDTESVWKVYSLLSPSTFSSLQRTRRASGRCTLSSVRRRSPPYNGHGERLEGVLSPQSVDVLLPTTDTESVWKVYSLLSPSTFSSLQRTRRASGRCTLSSVRRRSPPYNGHGERLEGVLSPQSVDVLLPTTDTESVWKVYSLLSPSTFSSLQRTRRASGRCTLSSVRRRSPPYNGHGERLEGVLSPQSVDVLLPTTDTESVWKVYSLLSPSTFSSLQRTRRASGRCTLSSVRRRSPPYNGHGERLEGVLSSQSVDVLLPTTDTESVWKVYSLLSPSTFSSLQRTRRASGRCTLSSVRRRSPPYNGHGERLEGVLSPQSVDVLLPTTDTESVWKVYSLLSPSTFSSLQRTRRASGRCTLSSVRRRSPPYNGHGERLEGVLSPQSVDVLLPTTDTESVWKVYSLLSPSTFSSLQRTRRASGRCTLSSVRRRSPAYNGHGERLEGVLSPQSVDVLLPTATAQRRFVKLKRATRTRRASGRCTLSSVRRRSPPYNGHGERLEGVLSPQSVDVLLPTTDTESVWKVYSLLSPSTFSSLQRTRRASGRCTLSSVRRRSPPYNGHGERLEGVLSPQSVDVLLPTTDTESVWKVYSLLSPSTFSSLQRTRRASGRCTLFSVRRRSPPYNGHGERLEGVLSPQSVDVLLPTTTAQRRFDKLKRNPCTDLGVFVQVYPTGVLFT